MELNFSTEDKFKDGWVSKIMNLCLILIGQNFLIGLGRKNRKKALNRDLTYCVV